jgi:hypothetical protein
VNIRHAYLLAGILWALVLAPLAAVAAIGVAAGFTWLFLFGDNPWPAAANGVLLALGAAAGLAVAAACVGIAYALGRRKAQAPDGGTASAPRRALALSVVPVVLGLILVALLSLRARDYESATTEATVKAAAFADFLGGSKKIVDLAITPDAQDGVRALVRFAGTRTGDYRLRWRVIPSSSNKVILTAERTLRLADSDQELPIAFAMEELRDQYRAIVLSGRGGALIDERFVLEVSLAPIVTSEERQKLPPGEARRLDTPDSPLESRKSTDFPVRFTIPN